MNINNENDIRFFVFIITFIIVALWEIFIPRRKLHFSKLTRWYGNLSIILFNSLIQSLISQLMVVGVAVYCIENKIGLFNNLNTKYYLLFFNRFNSYTGSCYLYPACPFL